MIHHDSRIYGATLMLHPRITTLQAPIKMPPNSAKSPVSCGESDARREHDLPMVTQPARGWGSAWTQAAQQREAALFQIA